MEENVKLFQSLKDLRKESDDISQFPSFTVVEEDSRFLINILQNIINKPSEEIMTFIQRYHTSLLNYLLFTESAFSRSSIQRIFTNNKFLNVLFNTLGSIKLEQYEIIFLNRIAYDYLDANNPIEKDSEVSNLLLQITNYINGNLIIKLSSKIDIYNSRLLAMINYSTDDQEIRIDRINRFLVNYSGELDTQSIIDIMFFLYDHFMYPIIYTLLEPESICMDNTNLVRYHNLMNAIINILISVPTEKMCKILSNYAYIVNTKNITPPVKLKAINHDRLQNAIKLVELDPLVKEIL